MFWVTFYERYLLSFGSEEQPCTLGNDETMELFSIWPDTFIGDWMRYTGVW